MPGPSRDTGYGLSTAVSQLQRARSDTIRGQYWDPFSDLASRKLPDDVARLRELCRYWLFTHPVISPLVQKASKYVVTSPTYSGNQDAVEKYRRLLERHLKVRLHIAEFNIDYNGFGVGYSMVLPPFRKLLFCAACRHPSTAAHTEFSLEDGLFRFKCRKCGYNGIAKEVVDVQFRSPTGIRLIRLNPDYMRVKKHPITGEKTYTLVMPRILRNSFTTNQRDIIARTPQVFIDAYRKKMDVEFLPGQIFCAERPSPSNDLFVGHGVPMIMPALKDAYLMQIAKRAQEAILLEHVLPIRFAYPAQGPDLARIVSMDDLTGHIREQLRQQRYDQTRFIVFPFAIGVAEFGGQGRALLLNPELREMAVNIAYACGFPQEFLFGGLSYSGSNVSLRMLENEFMFAHEMNVELLQFIVDRISNILQWPSIEAGLKRFKMADDLQRAAFDAQLVDRKWLSVSTLLQDMDKDPRSEIKEIEREIPIYGKLVAKQQIEQAKASSEAMIIQARAQAAANAEMQAGQAPPAAAPAGPAVEGAESPTQLGTMQFDTHAYANYVASQLQAMPPAQRNQALAALKQEQPGIASLVMDILSGQQPVSQDESFMQPLPEQLPPRRQNSPI